MTQDHINSPSHYIGSNGVQGIDVVDALGWGPQFCLGNAVKYILRAGRKSPDALTDLRKARRNCEMALEMVPPRATNDSRGRRTVIRQAVVGFALSEARANLLEEISMLPSIGGVEWQRRLGFIVKMLSEEIRRLEDQGRVGAEIRAICTVPA